jgi:hypothetical protein
MNTGAIQVAGFRLVLLSQTTAQVALPKTFLKTQYGVADARARAPRARNPMQPSVTLGLRQVIEGPRW